MTAQEMFLSLGYEIDEKNDDEILYIMEDEQELGKCRFYHVGFVIEQECFSCFVTERFKESKSFDINIDLLRAINKQCEELGWIEGVNSKSRAKNKKQVRDIKICPDLITVHKREPILRGQDTYEQIELRQCLLGKCAAYESKGAFLGNCKKYNNRVLPMRRSEEK